MAERGAVPEVGTVRRRALRQGREPGKREQTLRACMDVFPLKRFQGSFRQRHLLARRQYQRQTRAAQQRRRSAM